MTETEWDKFLKIKTTGRDDSHSDQYRYPYEPTPYRVLERLAGSGYIGKRNTVLDYGCGKGRVGLFLAYQIRCRCVGIEYDERIYEAAVRNKESAAAGTRADFVHARAEVYKVPDPADRFYFFYYPSDEYVSYLMTVDELMFVDEIDCQDLFEGDSSRERIMVFEMA